MNDICKILNSNADIFASTEDNFLDHYSWNFGNIYSKRALIVVCVRSINAIRFVLAVSQQYDIPLNLRGVGHSFGDQGLSEGILLVTAINQNSIIKCEHEIVEASAFESWMAVEHSVRKYGYSFPVLTRHPNTSVGGTLAVGGYGENTFRFGSQASCIDAFSLILPSGESIQCSEEINSDYYRYGLTSLGSLGVIEKIVFKGKPTVVYNHVFQLTFIGLVDLVVFIKELPASILRGIDALTAQHHNGYYLLNCTLEFSKQIYNEFLEYVSFFRKISHQSYYIGKNFDIRTFGAHRPNLWRQDQCNFWGDYCIDEHDAESFAIYIEQLISNETYNRLGGRLLLIVKNDAQSGRVFPFEPISPLMKGKVFGFGIYFTFDKNNKDLVKGATSIHDSILENCIAFNGRPYLAGWHDMSLNVKMDMYGKDFLKLRELRKLVDPKEIFNRSSFFG